jgi:hypothetical protein
MIKVKRILISLAVLWLVIYALMFLLNGIVFPPASPAAGDHSTQPMVDPAKAIVKVSASVNVPALAHGIGQSKQVDLFTRPLLATNLVTVMAGLAVACGYQLVRLGCRSNPPLLK